MTPQLENNYHASSILERFNEFRKEGRFCDFTIRAAKFDMQVHKLVIAASSEYFDAMLKHDTKESQNSSVEIKGVEPQYVVQCIEFMYSGKAPRSMDNPSELLQASLFLQMPELTRQVMWKMKKELSYKNLFFTRKIAIIYGHTEIIKACDELACEKFHEFMKSDGFLEIEAEYLMYLLSSGGLKIIDDIKVKAIMTWVSFDEGRAPLIIDFMKHIDINNVEISYRRYLLDYSFVFKSPECLQLIADSLPDDDKKVMAADYPGDCNAAIITINDESRRLQRFDLEKKSWIEMHPLEEHIDFHWCRIIVVRQYLYVFVAGYYQYTLRLRYTDSEAVWEELDESPEPVNGYIEHLKGMIYITDNLSVDRYINQYDIAQDSWLETPHKKMATRLSGLVAARGLLFVIGGSTGGLDTPYFINEVECYDPDSSTWSQPVCNLMVARTAVTACSHKEAIYVFGGYNSTGPVRSLEILYPGKLNWELVQMGGLDRKELMCHSLGGMIYLVSGKWGRPDNPQIISVYDSDSQSIVSNFPFVVGNAQSYEYHSAATIM